MPADRTNRDEFYAALARHDDARLGKTLAEKETLLAVPLARLLTTPDMWRTFTGSYLQALEVAGCAHPKRPRTHVRNLR
jgi:hypothetical protein